MHKFRSFQVFFGSLASFIMMFAPGADPELAILGLVFFFSFILAPVIIAFRDIFEAIDAFRKVRYEYFGLSFVSVDTVRIIGSIAVVFFVFSLCLMGFIVFLKLNIAWIFYIFYGAINIFIWAAQLFHMGILSFLWSLKDFLGDPFFSLHLHSLPLLFVPILSLELSAYLCGFIVGLLRLALRFHHLPIGAR